MLGHPWLEFSVSHCAVAAAAVCNKSKLHRPSYTVAAAGVVTLVSTSCTLAAAAAAAGVVSPSAVQASMLCGRSQYFKNQMCD